MKVLYVYTLVGAGGFGLWVLFAPGSLAAAFGLPAPDPYLLGIGGAVDAAFGVIAALALRAPERFAPAFLLQLGYKALWLIVVFAPRAVHGGVPGYAWLIAVVFASYVVLDVIALPFASMLSRTSSAR